MGSTYMPGRRRHQPSRVLSMLRELCGQDPVMEFPWLEAGTTFFLDGAMVTPGDTAHERHQAAMRARTEISPPGAPSYEERPL